jgi:Leucine-rich repeat (LRR) protein
MSIEGAGSSSVLSTRLKARKMTKDLLLSGTTFPRHREESTDHYLGRITHLHLQSKRIRHIESLETSNNLQVLYLYDNYIEVIENLSHTKTLKCLFLSNNLITAMPPIANPNLEKLRLDENEIEIIQGLDECPKLQELSVAKQRIPAEMQFDYNSLRSIARTLTYLDVSGNNITTLAPLICLESLEHFLCTDNHLAELVDLEPLQAFRYLMELDLKGNPVCKVYRYSDTVIGYSAITLRLLDELPLTRKNIDSMRAVQMHRQKVQLLKSQPPRAQGDDMSQDEDGLDARRTLEDSNDYRNEGSHGDDGGGWSDMQL